MTPCSIRSQLQVGVARKAHSHPLGLEVAGLPQLRVFLVVVALAVILLFKNAETPGAFLRHQVGGQGLRSGGLENRLPGHCVEI